MIIPIADAFQNINQCTRDHGMAHTQPYFYATTLAVAKMKRKQWRCAAAQEPDICVLVMVTSFVMSSLLAGCRDAGGVRGPGGHTLLHRGPTDGKAAAREDAH